METASFTGFVKTIFYSLMFYYVLKFLAKLFLPLLVKKVVEKAGQNFQQQQQNYSQDNSWQRTAAKDEIIYNTANAKKPKETKKVGDYVDYEEID
ncbi:DUF4834 family protein [Flavobacterium sp.]|uniref:DUF4834 family protein n=1 Tax=Flavobacterium sp. TaxID=239 RepID=UPI00260C01D3|nr:DUF4834 family protein [Flavobacterium sp.]MDG2432441.1 DUF4834 family protein [Flavobacterium sp.]